MVQAFRSWFMVDKSRMQLLPDQGLGGIRGGAGLEAVLVVAGHDLD